MSFNQIIPLHFSFYSLVIYFLGKKENRKDRSMDLQYFSCPGFYQLYHWCHLTCSSINCISQKQVLRSKTLLKFRFHVLEIIFHRWCGFAALRWYIILDCMCFSVDQCLDPLIYQHYKVSINLLALNISIFNI